MKKIIKKLNKNKISKARQELHKTTCIPWIFLNFFHYFLQKYHVGRFLIIFVYVPSLFLGLWTKKSKGKLRVMETPLVHQGFPPLSLIYAIAVKEYYLIDVQTTPCLCYGQKDFLKGFFEPLSERNTTKSASFWSVYHEKSVPPRKERQQSVLGRFRKFHELISFPRKWVDAPTYALLRS